ncbi:MAG: polysaccharide pyruvyl transferase family protein [Clostridia bacterium]|nr:polysaccharide pyruvyl transferase family protein [Clostridia bacterium]
MKHSIITIHHIHNFGSVFQAFALQQFLEQNGYGSEIIDYRPKYYNNGRNKLKTLVGKALNIGPYCRRKKKYEQFISKNMLLSEKRFKTVEALNGWYRDKKNTYIAGGDQLWNNYHPCGNDVAYKLAFTASGRKLAYGTSLGRNDYSAEEMELIASEVEGFESIMLREQSTVPLLADKTEIQVRHVIDPVGLLDVDEFRKMAVKPKLDEPYAVMYLADSGPLLDKAIEILSKKMGLKIVHICGFRKKCYCDIFEKDTGPEELLGYILNAQFVLSASFHATMFSVLFNKPFATLLPGTKTNARIEDLLDFVGLKSRMVNSESALDCLSENIEWTAVNDIVNGFRADSCQALLKALAKGDNT